MDPAAARQCWIAYHALVGWLDEQVGRLLEAIDDDTAVLFTADHGASLGEGGLWAKQCFRPAVHRVPSIIAGPGRSCRGSPGRAQRFDRHRADLLRAARHRASCEWQRS